ncbi:MAG: F0F1 ATP synthase subunit A [Holosporaceae bacterium]|jgi:F-type H+-transporting ATPase subunit a|nr:F0F1 ATP synthase subunit A [Holosporaceae bacterium]
MLDPLHQFVISPILKIKVGSLDLSFTNSSFAVMVALFSVVAFLTFGARNKKLIPDRAQALLEKVYLLIIDLIDANIGKEGRQYFPFIFSVFLFVLFGNVIGLIPGMFTFTSHIIVTFALAMFVFIVVTVLGFMLHGIKFLGLFAPSGVPWFLMPLVILIELISYLMRPFSLAIRLFANMMAGHAVLKIFAGLIGVFPGAGACITSLLIITPLNVCLTGLELMVAILQAYIFALLTCVYLNDAVHLH